MSSNKPFGSHDLLFDHLLIFHKIQRPLPSLNMNIPYKNCSINDNANILIFHKTFLFHMEQFTVPSPQGNSP